MKDDVKIKLIASFSSLVFVLLIGTATFHNLEGWTWVDSLYFTSITITTVGYGDLFPTHDASKIVTVIFSFIGVAIALFALTSLGHEYFEKREERLIRKVRHFSFNKSRDQNQQIKKSVKRKK